MIKKCILLILIMASLSYCKTRVNNPQNKSFKKQGLDTKESLTKPTLKLEKITPFSLTGANSLESAFKTTDARYVEYYVCEYDNSNNCAPSKDKPKSVPAKLGSISTSSSIRGEVKLTARACNYRENIRSSQKSCSEWQNIKINIPKDENDKLSKKLKEREILVTQKSSLCPDFIDTINKMQNERGLDKKQKEIFKAISDQGEDYCRFLMESAAGEEINRELKDKKSPLYKKIQSSVKKEQQTLSLSEEKVQNVMDNTYVSKEELDRQAQHATGEVVSNFGIFVMAVSGIFLAYNSYFVASIGGARGLKYSSGKFLKYGIGGFVGGIPIALLTAASLSGSSGRSSGGNTYIFFGSHSSSSSSYRYNYTQRATEFKTKHTWAADELNNRQIVDIKESTSWIKGSGLFFGIGAAFLTVGQIMQSQSLAEDPNFNKLQKVNKEYEDINSKLKDNMKELQKIIAENIDKNK